MAHKKGVGSSDNGRDSKSKRLGVKLFGGQFAKAGNIIIRQRGTKYHLGEYVYMGRDHTIHAMVEGNVTFSKGHKNRTFVSINPTEAALEELARNAAAGGSKAKKKKPAEPKAQKKAIKAEKQKKEKGPGKKKQAESKKADQASKADAKVEATPVVDVPTTDAPISEASKIADIPADNDAGKADASFAADDLTKIEGIGPKIAQTLNANGIASYHKLANTDVADLNKILEDNSLQMHEPATWPKQADMASRGQWDELKKWQDELDGGKPADDADADAKAAADAKAKAEADAKAKEEADAKAKAEADAKAKEEADAKAKAEADAKAKAEAEAKDDAPAKKAKDDLTKIEGIGPKIQEILVKNGLDTYEDLANCKAKGLKMILEAEGSRYQMHDPTTWPQQARFAADGKWDELKKWQDELDGGVGASAKEEPKAKEEPAAKKEAPKAKKKASTKKDGKDDLRKIEGIGPKIQEKLNDDGIMTFKQLADASQETLQAILDKAGSRYRMHSPATWPQQAALAADDKWDELKVLQDELDGGRKK